MAVVPGGSTDPNARPPALDGTVSSMAGKLFFPFGRSASFPARATLHLPSYDCAQPKGGCRNAWTRSVSARCENQDDSTDPEFASDDAECLGYGDYGFVGEARFFDTARAYWKPIGDDGEEVSPGPTEPANNDDIQKLAYAVARDFYGWRKFAFDVKHDGLAPVIPNGYADEVVWRFDGDDWSTRMMTAPADDRPEQLNHAFTPPDNCTCCEPARCDAGGCPSCEDSTKYIAKTGAAIPAMETDAYAHPTMGKGIVRLYRNDRDGALHRCGYAFAFNEAPSEVAANTWIQLGVSCGQYIVDYEVCPGSGDG